MVGQVKENQKCESRESEFGPLQRPWSARAIGHRGAPNLFASRSDLTRLSSDLSLSWSDFVFLNLDLQNSVSSIFAGGEIWEVFGAT